MEWEGLHRAKVLFLGTDDTTPKMAQNILWRGAHLPLPITGRALPHASHPHETCRTSGPEQRPALAGMAHLPASLL
ncbi:hypothetical protein AAFF_G00084960 [Aldrovandia affinis]|uniref:Uncharacterized protein n=1 Tax=Aldrovandia affinis TaxID=143900 RepID=A0AAD7RX96_9TELE|nr:hypothetical protein AAFF_G00084960 [Aldrovandia affinis]